MGKSLTETAKAVLLKEDPTPNSATLKPMSKSVDPNPMDNKAEDLGGDTPTSQDKNNLGAKASGKMKKDSSKAAQAAVPAQTVSEDSEIDEDAEVMEEDIEISEELEAFITELTEQGLSEEEIAQAIEENFEIIEEDVEELSEKKHSKKDKDDDDKDDKDDLPPGAMMKKVDMKEHVDALLAGEDLSEDFRSKAETIFESAVTAKVNEELSVLEEAYAKSLEEEVEKIKTELQEQIDDYLNYVVEQWVEENEVAIESGLRTELTEDFISGLRTLFAEHYIDIPEEKIAVIDELGSKVETLETKLNEEIEHSVELKKQLNEAVAYKALVEACEGLTTTQAEKLKALAENVSFTTADEFASKIHTLKESYFFANVNTDNVLDTVEDNKAGLISEETSGRMSVYVKALGKVKK